MNKQDKGNGDRGIEWTQYTWNPIAGCQHGCQWQMPDGSIANCYAEDVANRVAMSAYPHGFEHHYWKPQLLDEPLRVKAPFRIFVGSMADVFGHWVPDEQIEAVLDICRRAHWHTFQFLTKNAPKLRKFTFPANCWVGVSVPPTQMFGKALSQHQQTEMLMHSFHSLQLIGGLGGPKLWLSIEPLSWDIAPYLRYAPIHWAVIGAATNGRKVYQPDPAWVENALTELDQMHTPVFFKGNLHGNPAASPWREEFPVSHVMTQAALL